MSQEIKPTIHRNWYVIFTKSRQERIAIANLHEQKYNVYLPLIKARRRRNGRYIEVIEPMFSRYLFIHLNKEFDNWSPIRSTPGVTGLVQFGLSPAAVPSSLIKELQSKDDHNGIHKIPIHEFRKGDLIRIGIGPMAGYEGIFVAKSGQERALILLDIIGKATQVQVPECQLEVASK